MPHSEALMYASLMATLAGVSAATMSHYSFMSNGNGNKVRVAVCNLIYKKSLRLSQTALHDTSPGKMVNLLSNDVSRFEMVSTTVHSLWLTPIFTLIVIYFLCQEMQWAAILGLTIVFIVLPVQSEFVQIRIGRVFFFSFHQ